VIGPAIVATLPVGRVNDLTSYGTSRGCTLPGVRNDHSPDDIRHPLQEYAMQPGYPGQPPQINNNMTMSIVSLFLFWPLAIPAIIQASKVNTLLQQGDYHGAEAAAKESRKWSKLAIIIGLVWYAVVLLCCLLGGLAAIFGGNTSSV
jgi:hypothetical protein